MSQNPEASSDVTDRKLLRRVFGTFATGVTVVTVGGANPHGMTANSFTSVSLDPPLVLVCVDREAVMHRSLRESRFFAISILAADQEPVAWHFANRWRPLGLAQFEAFDWVPGPMTGAPLIGGATAWLECGLWRTYDGGDHTIFLGNLLSMERQDDSEPVLFLGGRFRQVTADADEVPT